MSRKEGEIPSKVLTGRQSRHSRTHLAVAYESVSPQRPIRNVDGYLEYHLGKEWREATSTSEQGEVGEEEDQ